MKSNRDIIILGSGGGGFSLALLLASKGFQVAIVEPVRRAPLPRHAEILQPSGIQILDRLGLLQAVLDEGAYRWHRVHFIRATGEPLCTIDYRRLPPPHNDALIILPETLRNIFLRVVEATPSIQMVRTEETPTLLWKGGQIVGVVADSHTLHAPIVVGADGVFSRMREAMGVPTSVHTYANGYFALALERPDTFCPDLRFYIGKGIFFAVMPGPQKKIYLLYQAPRSDQERIRSRGIEAFKANICSLNSEIAEFMEGPLEGLQDWTEAPFLSARRVRCARWTVGGGALLGDAAHAMNPHVAQGRNAAMADAVVLSEVIETCFRQGDFSPRALSVYEARRRPEISAYQRLADELTWLWESRFPPLVWARERIFRTIHQDHELHDKILTTTAGTKIAPFNLYDRWRALHLWGTVPSKSR